MEYKLLSSIFYSDNKNYENFYQNRYNSESTYKFDFKVGNYNAFVVINHHILQGVEKIIELDRELVSKLNSVPQIAVSQYTKKCLIDEIKMTNEIEGVNSTRKEINDILKNKTNNKKQRLYGLVKKYEMLVNEDIKLETCKDIRELYNEFVLQEVIEEDPNNQPDGNIFRKGKVYVQSPTGKVIHTGIYPEDKIIESMSECLNILNSDEYNFLIRIAIFHYMFGYIHPFYDGNGRMSRFISSYLLSRKLQHLVSYRLSYTIKENIKSYYKIFKVVNDEKNRGDLTSFVLKFFDIIIESLNDLCISLTEKYDKLKYFENIVNNISKDAKMKEIYMALVQNTLFGDSGLNVEEICEISNAGNTKVRKCLKILDEKGALFIDKDGRKNIYDLNLDKIINLII